MSPLTCVTVIVALYHARGGETYGEGVTQVEHAVQCAQLAAAAGAPPSLVAAALLHDIGHLLGAPDDGDHDGRHEVTGARALGLFGCSVRAPIALHVAAKRFLCATDPSYVSGLSAASRHSLTLQGGPFDAPAAAKFARLPFAADAVALRRFDDCGKSATPAATSFDAFIPLLDGLAHARSRVAPTSAAIVA